MDVPEDPTGEFERERAFVLHNLDLCRLAAVSLLLVEGRALLLAMMLRAMHSDAALADNDDYIPPHPHPNSRLRQPLLRPPHMAPPPPYSTAIPSSSADAAAAGAAGGSGASGVGVGGAADGAAAAAAAAGGGGEGGAAACDVMCACALM
ncbi:unnamed protein product [Closterium sp. NIES-65]|nr:unnamed protein product [Closterium sp. NIES-65]